MKKLQRGVVIAGICDARLEGDQTMIRVPHLDPALVRTSLLYWDRIDIPEIDIVTIQTPPEMKILLDEGILTRKYVRSAFFSGVLTLGSLGPDTVLAAKNIINGSYIDPLDNINNAPLKAFEELVKEKEVLWSYFQNSTTALIPSAGEQTSRSLLFEINQALPVPDAETPYEKILEFKNERAAELIILRTEIDSIYQEIINSSDIDHAKSMNFNRLGIALSDLEKCANESWSSRLKRSLKFEATPTTMIAAALAAEKFFPASISAKVLLVTASFVKINLSDMALDKNLPPRSTPYKYILDANKEIGLKLVS